MKFCDQGAHGEVETMLNSVIRSRIDMILVARNEQLSQCDMSKYC